MLDYYLRPVKENALMPYLPLYSGADQSDYCDHPGISLWHSLLRRGYGAPFSTIFPPLQFSLQPLLLFHV